MIESKQLRYTIKGFIEIVRFTEDVLKISDVKSKCFENIIILLSFTDCFNIIIQVQ
jgi:hypothetical protein